MYIQPPVHIDGSTKLVGNLCFKEQFQPTFHFHNKNPSALYSICHSLKCKFDGCVKTTAWAELIKRFAIARY
jgi:hypothetical protein